MDQRTTAIDQDLKDIVNTRVAIAEKLELLEKRIIDTAEGATMKFSRMLDETTQTVNQMVDNTKAALDPVRKVDEYPWLMLGGAICAGFAIGLLESRTGGRRSGVYPYYPAGARASRVMPDSARQTGAASDKAEGVYEYYPTGPRSYAAPSDRARTSVWDNLSREFGQEAEEAKAVILQVGRSLLMELARKMMPEVARSFGINLSSPNEAQKDVSGGRRSSTAESRGQSRDRETTMAT
ncbi:MAG: hypothetical protein K0S58_181 [Nitrospira sp.]|jgi:hypothetical protein|nr:hypothetical protein [Nitrospira sp.]